jgi:hypothetical protein
MSVINDDLTPSELLSNIKTSGIHKSGESYPYYKQILTPKEIEFSSAGTNDAFTANVNGLLDYVTILVQGGGGASKIDGPLGDRYFIQTPAKCKDIRTGKSVTRSIYVNNIPDGRLPFLSAGTDLHFNQMDGLIPGALDTMSKLNPFSYMKAFFEGSDPSCMSIKLKTRDADNVVDYDTQFVSIKDIEEMDPCWFPDKTNPITKHVGIDCDFVPAGRVAWGINRGDGLVPQTGNLCGVKSDISVNPTNLAMCQSNMTADVCEANSTCAWDEPGCQDPLGCIRIKGDNGKEIQLQGTDAITQQGTGQKTIGCYNLNQSKLWKSVLKSGDNCRVKSIYVPKDIMATAYKPRGSWGNDTCSGHHGNPIPIPSGERMDLEKDTCAFLFQRKPKDDEIITISNKDGKSVYLNTDDAFSKPGGGQDQPGCYTLDNNDNWKSVLKDGGSCEATNIIIPSNVIAQGFRPHGSWGDNACDGNHGDPYIIPPGESPLQKGTCSFLFKPAVQDKTKIRITGHHGAIYLDVSSAITKAGKGQNGVGCYTLDESSEWQKVLKDGDHCRVKSIYVPKTVKAHYFQPGKTSAGGGVGNVAGVVTGPIGWFADIGASANRSHWGNNTCNGGKGKAMPITSGKEFILPPSACAFLFESADPNYKSNQIKITGRVESVYLDPTDAVRLPGYKQSQAGCYTLDNNSAWKGALKYSDGACGVKSITFPSNISVKGFHPWGSWGDNTCDGKNGKTHDIISGELLTDPTCAFLFTKNDTPIPGEAAAAAAGAKLGAKIGTSAGGKIETKAEAAAEKQKEITEKVEASDIKSPFRASFKNESFQNMNYQDEYEESSSLLHYLYLFSMLVFFCYILSRAKRGI